jgi:hypothetical protein
MATEMNRFVRALVHSCCVFVLVLASSCDSQRPEIQTLGFLEDYAQLAPGREGQASLIYIDGDADFSIYSSILIEPVVAWPESSGEPAAASRILAEELDAALRRELAHEFELVEQPRAGTLRLRAALASASDSTLVLEIEILDDSSGARLVAAVDHRESDTPNGTVDSASQPENWAVLIRNRLATFRQFDAAAHAREVAEAP